MGFYVPWVIDGAKHSARLFRREHQLNVGDGSGIARPADLKVQALTVPGTGFRVAAGGATAQSRDSSAASRESYAVVNDAQIIVPSVPGTGSSGGRRDLVILEITDPEMQSKTYPAPSSPEGWQDGGNFCRVTVIQDVNSLVPAAQRPVKSLDEITTGAWANVTGVTLAAINWPASTGTITNAMIEDLRTVQSPREVTEVRAVNLVGAGKEVVSSTASYPTGQQWPVRYTDTAPWMDIPSWATVVKIIFTISGYVVPGTARGQMWVQIGQTANPANVKTQDTPYDAVDVVGTSRGVTTVADTVKIPAALRGTKQQLYPMAIVSASVPAAQRIYADWGTSVAVTAVFQEVPD